MLLSGKNAIIYGAGGSIGRLVAISFAREGAKVHLCGRTSDTINAVFDEVSKAGGQATANALDASNAEAVQEHFQRIDKDHGPVEISFNLIGVQDSQGNALTNMTLDDYLRPISIGTATHFITATEAVRHMERHGSGVILALTATPSRLALPLVGGFGSYCSAIEGFYRTLAAETGPNGVRITWLRSAGSPETFAPDVASDQDGSAAGLADNAYLENLRQATLLRRFPLAQEIAEVATLIASDRASAMTAAAINMTCGQLVD